MNTPNNVIDLQAWREKKAAEKAQSYIESLVIETAIELLQDGRTIQEIGDSFERMIIDYKEIRGLIVTREIALRAMRKLGWLPESEIEKGGH